MPEVRIKKIEEKEIDTILAEDIDFQGVLSFEKSLMIKGKFKGEIRVSGDLYVGRNADVEAKVNANLISVRGAIKGDLSACSGVELFSTAIVIGDIITPNLEIESGCKFNGCCKMGEQINAQGDKKLNKHAGKQMDESMNENMNEKIHEQVNEQIDVQMNEISKKINKQMHEQIDNQKYIDKYIDKYGNKSKKDKEKEYKCS